MKNRALLTLHRRMGLISAVFVILLSSTGLILHYSAELGLDSSYIDSPSLLNWYGMETPAIAESYRVGERVISRIESAIYFDATRLPGNFGSLRGAVTTDFGYLLATAGQLILLTEDGELVEVLGSSLSVPRPIDSVARTAEGEILLSVLGRQVRVDLEALVFVPLETGIASPRWGEAENAPPSLQRQIREDYAASLLSWERIFLDLHSGRLLGAFGVAVIDVMAVLFLLMAITGVWIWSRRRPGR